jgi:H/ACA ribonucleoprotein complex subunit 2
MLTSYFFPCYPALSLVILAGDISPMDILSHIPILCEEQNVPYIFVPSKESLGAASSTKRPTSTVMVCPDGGKLAKKKGTGSEMKEDYKDEFESVEKEVRKLGEKLVMG